MSDNGQKSRNWLWGIEVLAFMLVVYTLSVIPAVLISDHLVLTGIVSRAEANRAIDGIYAPVAQIPMLRDVLKGTIEIADSLIP
jgi:hypothetical protein